MEDEGTWVKVVRLLRNVERRPQEMSPDSHIIEVARSARQVTAIRLYRIKHEVVLAEGTAGVEALLAGEA